MRHEGNARRAAPVVPSREAVLHRPVTHQNVFATLYHNLGIDPVEPDTPPIRELV